ncbi:MAG: PEGA domain-containing protein, partial [Planctomycetota bacterium]|nr:PEGA domain-containing protein [Planctomycetota bacterium]
GGTGGEKGPGQGAVIVSATPENCEVCVDGLFVGNAPTNLKLSEGIHIVEVKKVGHETFKRELRVLKGSDVVLRAELQKK